MIPQCARAHPQFHRVCRAQRSLPRSKFTHASLITHRLKRLVGTRFQHDFYNEDNWVFKIANLIKDLGNNGKQPTSVSAAADLRSATTNNSPYIWKIDKYLGGGGFAQVFLGSTSTGEIIAIKVIDQLKEKVLTIFLIFCLNFGWLLVV